MNSFKKINPDEFVESRKDDIVFFRKDSTVGMRPAIPGESITTTMKDGHVETTNVAKENQVVIKNPDGEQYIIDAKKFEDRYEYSKHPSVDDEGFVSFDAKGGPMQVIRLKPDENVEFTAPWGSPMQIKGGGVIVNNGPGDIYGIQPDEFSNTYKPCTQDGNIFTINELASKDEEYAIFIYSNGEPPAWIGRSNITPEKEKSVLSALEQEVKIEKDNKRSSSNPEI